jgi:hypothetical protein
MTSDPDITTIAHVIQLAIAPVFLLTGIGSLLAVMANRLARIIDRSRFVESIWSKLVDHERADALLEFASLSHRATFTSWAINLCAMAALLVCALIAALFIDAILGTSLRWLVGVLSLCSRDDRPEQRHPLFSARGACRHAHPAHRTTAPAACPIADATPGAIVREIAIDPWTSR